MESGGAWGNGFAYSLDLNLTTRVSWPFYDLGTFTVVPLLWNTSAGLDQEKVFQVVRARAHWNADEDQRRAATAHAVATQQWQCATGPLRRLSQPDRGELDLGWALAQYERQQGACFYTGVALALSGDASSGTTPFVLSIERLDDRGEYTQENTVFVAAEFNCGNGVQMSRELAVLLYGPLR